MWENLHWACQPCNVQKGAKWDRCFPILDGVLDPISHHLTYRIGGGGLKRWPKSLRGKTTIDHAGLNREKLVNTRTELAQSVHRSLRVLESDPDSPAAKHVRDELKEKADGEFGSLVAWLIAVFDRD